MLKPLKTVKVGGVETSCLGRKALAELLGNYAISESTKTEKDTILVFSLNGHSISEANSDPEYMKIMSEADLVHADGQSVVMFSKLFSTDRIEERTATTDMIHDMPNFFAGNLKHFLLGGKPEVVSSASEIMKNSYNNFEIAGYRDGFFAEEELSICEEINKTNPDVLWVGLGKPKEQEFCIRNKERLNVPVIITCGGCYNFITGDYSRAPEFMQKIGLEWLHRLMTNPKKLFVRYLTTNPHTIYCVIKHAIIEKRSKV